MLSVVRNFREQDPLNRKRQYFVHFKFLPGFGFYGCGLLHTIGGLSRAATSILRQLIDAGTLSNFPAGFKARGVRIRNDDEPLNPGEFRDIDVRGGDLKNSIIPLPYKEPSGTLAQLLGVVVDSGRRFAQVADAKVSDVNSQAPVGTTVALIEQGSKIISSINKRLHYAQKQEFRMLAEIFSENPMPYPYSVGNAQPQIMQQDFDGRVDILPVSDPNIFSMSQRLTLAQTQLQLAQAAPQIHNQYEAYRRMYDALDVKNIDSILPAPKPPAPVDPATENANSMKGAPLQVFPQQDHEAHLVVHALFLSNMVAQANPQGFLMLQSHVQEHVSALARDQVTKFFETMVQEALQKMVDIFRTTQPEFNDASRREYISALQIQEENKYTPKDKPTHEILTRRGSSGERPLRNEQGVVDRNLFGQGPSSLVEGWFMPFKQQVTSITNELSPAEILQLQTSLSRISQAGREASVLLGQNMQGQSPYNQRAHRAQIEALLWDAYTLQHFGDIIASEYKYGGTRALEY